MDPTPEQVTEFAGLWACSEERAKDLLKQYNNNPEKVGNFLREQQKYIARYTALVTPSQLSTRANTESDNTVPAVTEPGSSQPSASSMAAQPHSWPGQAPSSSGGVPFNLGFRPVTIPNFHQAMVPEYMQEWNFKLPVIEGSGAIIAGRGYGGPFNLHELVFALQQGASLDTIQNYLDQYDRASLDVCLNAAIEGVPSIFYAVATNNESIVRAWASCGADVTKATHKFGPMGVPLIAFAIFHSDTIQADTSAVVATLLSLGASPDVFPSDFYSPYTHDLSENMDEQWQMTPNTQWCTGNNRAALIKAASLTHRYYLDKANKTKDPSGRHRQVAENHNAKGLLGIPYFLVGQTTASEELQKKLLSYFCSPPERPMVLVFAGPSGHGKTELARKMGHLLGLDLEVVDCTIMRYESDLFGAKHPFNNAGNGSPLNNFIVDHAGKRCIVFLDEFEKTTSDIHKALLVPFENGEYQDRRNLNKINCTKTIWILATNALDPTIQSFCDQHKEIHGDDASVRKALVQDLGEQLKNGFRQFFGAPLTGRISGFVPFLPFSPGEQAVVAHKFLLELGQEVKRPVRLSNGVNGVADEDQQLLGDIYLRVRHDASVCGALAAQGYDAHTGARSLRTTIDSVVKEAVVEAYLEEEEEIKERKAGEPLSEAVVDIARGEIVVTYRTPGNL